MYCLNDRGAKSTSASMKAPNANVTSSVRPADHPFQRGTQGTTVVRMKSPMGARDLRMRGAIRRSGRGTRGADARNHSANVKRADIRGGSDGSPGVGSLGV